MVESGGSDYPLSRPGDRPRAYDHPRGDSGSPASRVATSSGLAPTGSRRVTRSGPFFGFCGARPPRRGSPCHGGPLETRRATAHTIRRISAPARLVSGPERIGDLLTSLSLAGASSGVPASF